MLKLNLPRIVETRKKEYKKKGMLKIFKRKKKNKNKATKRKITRNKPTRKKMKILKSHKIAKVNKKINKSKAIKKNKSSNSKYLINSQMKEKRRRIETKSQKMFKVKRGHLKCRSRNSSNYFKAKNKKKNFKNNSSNKI